MALEQKLQPSLQQKLVMTPALQLAIKLLQLNKLELEQELRQEMVQNPCLEQIDDLEYADAEDVEEEPEDPFEDSDIDLEEYLQEYYDAPSGNPNMREEGQAPPIENTLASDTSLHDHLLWQLEMAGSARQHQVGRAIVGNIDDDGYLQASVEELAEMGGWTVGEVENALQLVQTFDPAGVGARDLKECMLLQLEELGLEEDLAAHVVREHLDDVIAHRYKDIAKGLGIDLESVAAALEVIQRLSPKPGQAYAPERTPYIIPDVHVVKDSGEYRVTLNEEGLPRLRVSRVYRKMMRGSSDGLDEEAKDYLKDKMRSALWLIKSFGQRQRTILKVAESIVSHQVDFLEQGVSCLKPMVLRDVADDIEMHESTVSRVVNGKYMHTPRGTFEMKFFFHSGLGHDDGGEVSSVLVKDRIRGIIDDEDSRKPLSDSSIAEMLAEDGLQIARRTVAKYREEMGIPASQGRRSLL